MMFKEFLIWAFWVQNVGPGWVKNGKKGFFHTSDLSVNLVLPKNKVLNIPVIVSKQTKQENAMRCNIPNDLL